MRPCRKISFNFLRSHDRARIAAKLLGEVLCQLFPLEADAVPALLSMRRALLPRCSALVSEATAEGRDMLGMMVNTCLMSTAPVQDEPLTDQQMRMLSQPSQQHDELQKTIAAFRSKGWWTEQRAKTMS